MSDATTRSETGSDGTAKRIETAIDRLLGAIERDDPDSDLSETASELRDVVEEAGNLLETVDLKSLPDVVDLEELPTLVDVERLPTAIRERDPDAALDLRTIRHAIRLRELWNSVDLVEFASAKERLEDELTDVVGEDAMRGSGDSEAVAELRRVAAEIRPKAKNAAIQQQAQKGVEKGREGVIAAHAAFEELYEANQSQPGYVGRRPVSRNPTAVSLVPSGPVPDSASTRFSSVPSNVRQAAIDARPRIYGRRWRVVGRGRRR
ncbi:hypothetical protein OB955_24095 [Halobacteria archaeon AArc-m2/3/4]|uniref:Uncharacterized protein n=1 Tax=Natronoglomus mannanivorans TaxID=2979990 RepID=A0ABT2QLE8_9EURY|nr:hypothetical protein [Halobacteria archaeon AArc-m2/3/4]